MRIDPQRTGSNVQEAVNFLAAFVDDCNAAIAALQSATPMAVYPTMAAMRAGDGSASQLSLQGYWTPGDGAGGVFDHNPSDTTSPDDGGRIVIIAGKRFARRNAVPNDAIHFGVVPSTIAAPIDVAPAMQAALDATPRGGTLFVRACNSRAGLEYRLKSANVTTSEGAYALHLTRQVKLTGECADNNNASSGTCFRCDAGIGGVFIEGSDGAGGLVDARFSLLRDISFLSVQSGARAHAIYSQGTFSFERVCGIGFPGCGFFGNGSGGGKNMNCWTVNDCRFDSNLEHGWFITGNDSNAGRAVGLNCNSNRGVGLWDSSFLGNTYVACQTAVNGTSAIGQDVNGRHLEYKTDGGANETWFINCYAEQSGFLLLEGPASWIGQQWGNGPTPESGGHFFSANASCSVGFRTRSQTLPGTYTMVGELAPNDGTNSLWSWHLPSDATSRAPYRFGMMPGHKDLANLEHYSFVWANSFNYSPCGFTAENFYRGPGRLLVTAGYFSRSLTSGGSKWFGVSSTIPFSAPGSGLLPHEAGDRLEYDAPSLGAYAGRICMRAGFYAAAVTRNTAYTVGQKIRPLVDNGHVYNCTTAGTTHATIAPTYGVGAGSLTTDGTAIFTEFGASSLWAEYGQIANANI